MSWLWPFLSKPRRLWWPCPICANGANVNRLLEVARAQAESLEYANRTVAALEKIIKVKDQIIKDQREAVRASNQVVAEAKEVIEMYTVQGIVRLGRES